jgi:hypothetical protein
MPNNGNKRQRRGKSSNGFSGGASKTPTVSLCRKFRHSQPLELNNSTGSGLNQKSYYTKYISPQPKNAQGFREAQQTFEFWRMKNFSAKAIISYNDYNQTYNTINLDALASMQIWTAADLSANETISGESILSYNNAKVNTLSLNNFTQLVNMRPQVNDETATPLTILPRSTWLDTSSDQTTAQYSGFQLYAVMPGLNATNYRPRFTIIYEYEIEFKQPAYQNRPSAFEMDIVGALLEVIPNGSLPEEFREYKCVSYTIDSSGNDYRFERTDGQAGSLNYDQAEFFTLFTTQRSGGYFGDREVRYTGPIPRKPVA